MKLSNNILSGTALMEALGRLLQERLTAKACYWLTKITKELSKQAQVLEESRQSIIKARAVKEGDKIAQDKEGNIQFISDDEKDACIKEINDLYQGEFELSIDKPIEIPADVTMTAADYMVLDKIIAVKEE